MYAEPK
jgi:hypothetical protein